MDHGRHRAPLPGTPSSAGPIWNFRGVPTAAPTRWADVAELAGRSPPVRATNSIDDLIAPGTRRLLHNLLWPDIDELVRLLGRGERIAPARGSPEQSRRRPTGERIPIACETGKSTIFGSSGTPMTNMVRMVLSGACRTRRRDPYHRTGGLLHARSRPGTQPAMASGCDPDTQAGRQCPPGERGVRRVRRHDGRRDRRRPEPDDVLTSN